MLILVTKALPALTRMRESTGVDIGRLLTPREFSRASETPDLGFRWGADNDAFQSFDPIAFGRMLHAVTGLTGGLFVATPDVVADADATLSQFERWSPEVRETGQPVALVLQDGMDVPTVPWGEFDAVFVGGSSEWKMGEAAARLVRHARTLGLWAHMGRVNTFKRIQWAAAIGCQSFDGSGWSRFTDEMFRRHGRALREGFGQLAFEGGDAITDRP